MTIYAKIHIFQLPDGSSQQTIIEAFSPSAGFTAYNVPSLDYLSIVNGAIVELNLAATAAALTQKQLAEAKTKALQDVDNFHASTIQKLAGNPTQVEKDTWAMKLATATEVAGGSPISVEGQAFLLAAGMNTPALQSAWATRVQAKATKFSGLVGTAEKIRADAKAAILAAVDLTALDAAIANSRSVSQAAIAAFSVV